MATGQAPALIEIEGLTKRFGGFTVVSTATLTIARRAVSAGVGEPGKARAA